jgi:hypothetical protein
MMMVVVGWAGVTGSRVPSEKIGDDRTRRSRRASMALHGRRGATGPVDFDLMIIEDSTQVRRCKYVHWLGE